MPLQHDYHNSTAAVLDAASSTRAARKELQVPFWQSRRFREAAIFCKTSHHERSSESAAADGLVEAVMRAMLLDISADAIPEAVIHVEALQQRLLWLKALRTTIAPRTEANKRWLELIAERLSLRELKKFSSISRICYCGIEQHHIGR